METSDSHAEDRDYARWFNLPETRSLSESQSHLPDPSSVKKQSSTLRVEDHLEMLSLKDLCLNAVEENGTSVREALAEVSLPQGLLIRHPSLTIAHWYTLNRTGSLYGRDDPICPGIEIDRLEVVMTMKVEFDGVYTLKWSRHFDSELPAEELKRYGELLDEYHPQCSPGTGEVKITIDNSVVEEIVRLSHEWTRGLISAELLSPSGETLMDVQVFELEDLKNPIDAIRQIYMVSKTDPQNSQLD